MTTRMKQETIYDVFLNSDTCISYTLPNGIKIISGRAYTVQEKDIDMYKGAGVFAISPRIIEKEVMVEEPKVPSKNGREEKNILDREDEKVTEIVEEKAKESIKIKTKK